MAVRMMVLEDDETCGGLEGSTVIEFDNEMDADHFADYGSDDFELVDTTEMVSVPVVKAMRK